MLVEVLWFVCVVVVMFLPVVPFVVFKLSLLAFYPSLLAISFGASWCFRRGVVTVVQETKKVQHFQGGKSGVFMIFVASLRFKNTNFCALSMMCTPTAFSQKLPEGEKVLVSKRIFKPFAGPKLCWTLLTTNLRAV